MRSPLKVKGDTDTVSPTIQEPISTADDSIKKKNEGKESSTTSSAHASKPPPAQTPSTRILEPIQTSSQSDHAPTIQRGASNSKPQRPNPHPRRTTARIRYIDMLLGLDTVSPSHNILASASVWILLAGYIVFPATFTKLSWDSVSDSATASDFETAALHTVRNVPLLYRGLCVRHRRAGVSVPLVETSRELRVGDKPDFPACAVE